MSEPGPSKRSPPRDENPPFKGVKSNIDKMEEPLPSGFKRIRSPPRDENPSSKRGKSNIDCKVLLHYKDHFVDKLHSLGVVLGVKEDASAILATPGTLAAKYSQITDMWMQRAPNPTWDKFCSCLIGSKDFTCVRILIEQEQLGRHEDLASRPSEVDLINISRETGKNWKDLLRSLKIEEHKIGELDCNNPKNIAEACFQGLMFWENENAQLPLTWSTLIEALKKAKLTKFANELPPKENKPRVTLPVLEDTLHRSAGAHDDEMELVHSTPEDIIALVLGATGVGKSTFGNFVTGLGNSFEEGHTLKPQTKEVSLASHWMGDIGRWFRYMDSPGLNRDSADNPNSLAEAIAVSTAQLAMDLREVNFSFSVILIVTPLNVRDPSGILLMMNAMQNYDNFWDHSILLLTHANDYCPELTQEDKEKNFSDMLKSEECPKAFKSLADKVKSRFVIVESKDRRSDSQYRNEILKKIAAHSDAITKTYGHYKDKLHSIGREAYELSELQYIKDHPEANLESQGAKDEIYMAAFLRVKSVALKAIRIKLADGVDVEKLENIARMKDNELQYLEKEKKLMTEELNEKLRQAEVENQQLQGSISKLIQQLDDQKEQMVAAQKNGDEKHSQLTSELEADRQRNQQAQAEAQAAQEQLQQHIQGLNYAMHKKKKKPWYHF